MAAKSTGFTAETRHQSACLRSASLPYNVEEHRKRLELEHYGE